jgi:hypothetical protein
VKDVDDFPLNTYEWTDWIEGLAEFDIKRITPSKCRGFYFIILWDDVIPYDMDLWDTAMSKGCAELKDC